MRGHVVAIPLLLVVVILVVVVVVVQAAGRERAPRAAAPPAGAIASPPLPATARGGDLARWVDAGLLSQEQADAISAFESERTGVALPPPPRAAAPPRRVPVVAEALGYLGGVLALSGIGLVVSRYWADMAVGGRLAISGGAAAAFFLAGLFVHEEEDAAFARMRAFLWLASSGAVALFTGILVRDSLDIEELETVTMACGAAVALHSSLLWWWKDRPLQQLSALAGLAVFAGAAAAHFGDQGAIGITVWIVGVACLAIGLTRRTPQPLVAQGAGAVTLIVGSSTIVAEWTGFGLAFSALSALGLVTLALIPQIRTTRGEQLMIGVVGGLAAAQAVPSVLGYFTPEAAYATGLGTWAVGAALLFVGARRLTRLPTVVESVGGLAVLVGAALTGAASPGFASLFGIATAVGLIALGMLPGRVLLSLFGSLGLLVNVPWAIGWFFPGEGRAPLIMLISGALILGVAIWLTRMGGRFRRELGERPDSPTLS